jgi:hypothetical protein
MLSKIKKIMMRRNEIKAFRVNIKVHEAIGEACRLDV